MKHHEKQNTESRLRPVGPRPLSSTRHCMQRFGGVGQLAETVTKPAMIQRRISQNEAPEESSDHRRHRLHDNSCAEFVVSRFGGMGKLVRNFHPSRPWDRRAALWRSRKQAFP